jgi:hypothetical protein
MLIVDGMATPTSSEPQRVMPAEELCEHVLDTRYAQLALLFNSGATNAERRMARDRYALRSKEQQ